MFVCCQCGRYSQKNELLVVPKNEETLNQWVKQYNLQLNVKSTSSENYICKSHVLGEISNGNSPTGDEYMADSVDPETEFPMEIKNEIEEQVEETGDFWKEVKDESTDGTNRFGNIPFEMEQNSYSTFEDSDNFQVNKYEETCRPTTSSATGDLFDTLPVFYEDISDNQILSFCVKNSTNMSGGCIFSCGMCPEIFRSTDIRLIRLHLRQSHTQTMESLVSQGYTARAPKIYEPIHPMTKAAADKALFKFIIRNGLASSALQDRNLEMLAFNFNSEYEVPTREAFFDFMKNVAEYRANTQVDKSGGPMTVTFDTTSFNNVHYLAFTITYYKTRSELKRCIFLREIETAKPPIPLIISFIKKAVDEVDCSFPIASVVTGKVEFEEALEGMGSFEQVMVCFSQNMNEFAEELIKHPVFANPLKTLRAFIKSFPSNRGLWGRFKSFIVKRRTYGEFPELDEGHWYTTLDFLTKCLHMHRLFSEFAMTNQQLTYITVDDNVNMVYLHSLLGLCKSLLKGLVEKNATIAEIIPYIAEINESIGITTSRYEVVAVVTDLFRALLLPFVEQSDVHRFALFLHPLHHGTQLLPTLEWDKIQHAIARELTNRESADGVLGDTSGFTTLRDTVTAEREVADFALFVVRARDMVAPRLNSILEWWFKHSKRFPRLYKYARELLQIPAFSIDASHYFGEYGLLSHSIQETEVSKRKLLLLASSELMDYHAKGDVMNKLICVKRKRDPACPEETWYAPIDGRSFRGPEEVKQNNEGANKYAPSSSITPLPQTLRPAHLEYQGKVIASRPNQPYPHVPRTLKQEIEKLTARNPVRVVPKKYIVATPGTRGILQRKSNVMPPVPIKTIVPMATSAKKYYAVRAAPPSNQNPQLRTTSTVSNQAKPVIRRFPIVVNHMANATPPTKKVYFVRSKTGQKPQPPN